jgi:hypothetical protein
MLNKRLCTALCGAHSARLLIYIFVNILLALFTSPNVTLNKSTNVINNSAITIATTN